jgi:hypothetical protein
MNFTAIKNYLKNAGAEKFGVVSDRELAAAAGLPIAKNIVIGDRILWVEAIFSGSFRNAKFEGFSAFEGVIEKESYGSEKAQHTFTVRLADGTTKRKKGRTIFKHACLLVEKAAERAELQAEKNVRGTVAKKAALLRWLSENGADHPRYEEKINKLNNLQG